MVFSANPLSLSVPDPAFEAWLRDSGYLEILDSRSSTSSSSPPTCPPPPSASKPPKTLTLTKSTTASVLSSLISFFRTLISLLTLNPFAKLTTDDLAVPTPSWTIGFVGRLDSYSWPAGPSQARMRVQENVRRYVRNYAVLSLIFLACSLYQLPIPLLGVILSLLLWEVLRFISEKWEMEEKHPGLRQVLVRIVQFGLLTNPWSMLYSQGKPMKIFNVCDSLAALMSCVIASAVILYWCNLQLAFFCALSVSYAVMIFHASLRKLAPAKQAIGSSRRKMLQTR